MSYQNYIQTDGQRFELVFSLSDLNALPCYKVESEMKKVDPNADLWAPLVIDSSSPAPVEDLLEHRLGVLLCSSYNLATVLMLFTFLAGTSGGWGVGGGHDCEVNLVRANHIVAFSWNCV